MDLADISLIVNLSSKKMAFSPDISFDSYNSVDDDSNQTYCKPFQSYDVWFKGLITELIEISDFLDF